MNKEKSEQLKKIALRTIKILELLEQEIPISEIALKAKADRQLCEYYKKITSDVKSK